MSQAYNENIKKAKPQDTQLDVKNSCILPENSAEGLGSRRDCCWNYVVSIIENTAKDLVVQGRVHLGHSSHIVKIGV